MATTFCFVISEIFGKFQKRAHAKGRNKKLLVTRHSGQKQTNLLLTTILFFDLVLVIFGNYILKINEREAIKILLLSCANVTTIYSKSAPYLKEEKKRNWLKNSESRSQRIGNV